MGEREPRLIALVAAAPEIDASRREQLLPLAEAAAAKAAGVLVSTCHRVEWLADDDHGARVDLEGLTGAGMARLQGRAAASHVINMALGLESAVVGEDQILHQMRTAVTAARQRGALGSSLDPLLDHALRAGRLGRSWRPTHPSVGGSLADVAVLRIQAVIGRLEGMGLVTRTAHPTDGRQVIIGLTPSAAAALASARRAH